MTLTASAASEIRERPLTVIYDAPYGPSDYKKWTEQSIAFRDFNLYSVVWQQNVQVGRIRNRLTQLLHLTENWDSYGSPAPSSDIVRLIDSLVDWLSIELPVSLEGADVAPSSSGGIAVSFSSLVGNRYAHVELLNSKTARLLLSDDMHLIGLERLSQTPEALRDAIKKASSFVTEPDL